MSRYLQIGAAFAEASRWHARHRDTTSLLPCLLERGPSPLRLPPAEPPILALDAALVGRRSVRTYPAEEISSGVVSAAQSATNVGGALLGWALACRGVQGIPVGSYHVEPVDHGHWLHRVGEDPPAAAWPQAEFTIAPLVIVILANLAQPGQSLPIGLYQLAGRAAYAASIEAERRGLGTCIFYGPTLAARSAMKLDNVSRAPLLAVSMGVPQLDSIDA